MRCFRNQFTTTYALSPGSSKHPGQPMLHYNIGKEGGVSIDNPVAVCLAARQSIGCEIRATPGTFETFEPEVSTGNGLTAASKVSVML